MSLVRLRDLTDGDLDLLFAWEQDPRARAMAAFTRPDPADREAFDAHHHRIRDTPAQTLLAVEADGELVGTVGSYPMEGDLEVTYWIDPAQWGRGLASAALAEFLQVERRRPLSARVAEHNRGSITVLARAGFVRVGEETSYADGLGRDVVELVHRLDA